MKEFVYSPDSWVVFIKNAKEYLKRELTQREYRDLMKSYINGLPVKAAIKKLEGG